jgi:hypothetical protein
LSRRFHLPFCGALDISQEKAMFRLIPGTLSVALIGCVVVVQAQDTTRFWSAAKGTRPTASSGTAQRSIRGTTVHHDPAVRPVSDETPSSAALRSVLKRNATPSAAPAPAAPGPRAAEAPAGEPVPAADGQMPATNVKPAAASAPPASASAASGDLPKATTPEIPRAAQQVPKDTGAAAASPPTGPASSSAPRTLPVDDAAGVRISSRRSPRSPLPATAPLNVAAKPVPTQRVASTPNAETAAAAAGDSPTTLAKNQGPALRVDVVGPAAATLGEETAFKIQVMNPGEADAAGVTVRIGVPEIARLVGNDVGAGEANVQADGGVTQVVWTLERLPARAASELTLKLVPTTTRPIELSVDWSIKPVTATARIEVKQALLEMSLSGPGEIVYGDTKVFSIVLSNPGTGDVKEVAVNVSLGPNTSDTMNVGTIPAGTSKHFDFEVTARQTGTMQISAAATAAGGLKQEAVHPVLVQRAELAVTPSGPEMEFAGSVANYSVRVANRGNATARNVHVVVRMPPHVRYLQGDGNVRPEANGMLWQLGDLGPGTEREFRFDCELTADGDAQFQVAARGDGGLESTGDLTTRVDAAADLTLTVNDPKGPIPVGQDVVYEVNISNRGTKAASQVHVVAQFSDGIEPVATDGMPGEIQTGQVVFQPIARINPKETLKLTVKAKAQTGGNHVFRAAVQCTDPETRLVAEDSTRFYSGSAMRRTDSPAPTPPGDRGQESTGVAERPATPAAGQFR